MSRPTWSSSGRLTSRRIGKWRLFQRGYSSSIHRPSLSSLQQHMTTKHQMGHLKNFLFFCARYQRGWFDFVLFFLHQLGVSSFPACSRFWVWYSDSGYKMHFIFSSNPSSSKYCFDCHFIMLMWSSFYDVTNTDATTDATTETSDNTFLICGPARVQDQFCVPGPRVPRNTSGDFFLWLNRLCFDMQTMTDASLVFGSSHTEL